MASKYSATEVHAKYPLKQEIFVSIQIYTKIKRKTPKPTYNSHGNLP
jgi:hypothetical protein